MTKIALITGCSSSLGQKIAVKFGLLGYKIIGTYNSNYKAIDNLKTEFKNKNIDFNFYNVNFLDDNSLSDFVKKILLIYKKIDILINNAALSLDDDLGSKTMEDFMNIYKVNVVAPFFLIKSFADILNGGVIINISSTDGINTFSKYNIDYSASKAALINLTKSLSLILDSIKIYAICPNWIDTESVRLMNTEYLKEEMLRIGQKKLISTDLVINEIINLIKSNNKSGTIVVLEDGVNE